MGLIEKQTVTAERREHRRGGRAFCISIAVVLVLSTLAIVGGGLSRNAAAVTTWQNATGWMGNKAIYMSVDIYPGVTGSGIETDSKGFGSNVLPEWNVSTPNNIYGLNNSVSVAVGVRSQDAIKNMMFYEAYDGTAGVLHVYIPVAVIGASYAWGSAVGTSDIECLYASLRNMYLPDVGMQIYQPDTFGINATGTLSDQGTPPITKAQNDLMGDAFWAAAEAIPGVGTIHTWSSMYQTYLDAAKAVATVNQESFLPPVGGSAAGMRVIHSYNVINNTYWRWWGQSPTYDVFGTSMYVNVDINKTDFSTYPPGNWTFTVNGQNWANNQLTGCISGQLQAASQDLYLYAYPAIEVEGTVYAAGAVVPNSVISLSDGGSNVYTFETNSQGNYRFFAKPGTAYTLMATYGTTFGNAQASQPFTTGNDPTAPPQYVDLHFPVSKVSGTVYAYSGGGVYNAKVTVTDTVNNIQTYVCTDSYGNYFFYTNGAGTYTYNSIGSYYYAQAGPASYYFYGDTVYSGYSFTLGSGSSTGCGSPPGGGGGCLLSGTQIVLADNRTGQINELEAGDQVLGYSATSGAWVLETVTSNTHSFANQVLSIDNGLLKATLTDQPLYVRNGTWTGWIRDPQDLIPGEQIFLPANGTWVNVTSLQILTGNFKVYDLEVSAPNDFVANGVLVGDKCGQRCI